MRIIVLTPIYEITTSTHGATPVVHYFARQWARSGHDVTVFNFVAKYPKPFYWISRVFQHKLNSYLGMLVPIFPPKDVDFQAEGVSVHRRCLKKTRPHARYSLRKLHYALECVKNECELNGVPNWFIGHWDNPQLELLTELKKCYNRPIGLVLHNNDFDFERKYGNLGIKMLKEVDVLGFRSEIARKNYVKKYGELKHSFIAYSGVSELFLSSGESLQLKAHPVHSFLFVGSLIARKNPALILSALAATYPDGDFVMTYIGDGAERQKIEAEYQRLGCLGIVRFVGRVPREKIIPFLKEAEVFVMVSKGEIFGLVYLEAMAMGLIPIGSRNEGIDGIIKDGDNGFLCEAGNEKELTRVLNKLKMMTSEQLAQLSRRAKETAFEYSDESVAEKYLEALSDSQK